MAIHELKTWTEFYDKINSGEKTFEVRFNDRGYKVGDKLVLYDYDNNLKAYTGQYIVKEVAYILHGGSFGIESGYVVMSLK